MRIGIDVGGTKIEGVVLAPGGEVRFRERIPAVRNDYDGTVAAIVGLVQRLERTARRRCTVGVGVPGTICPHTGRMKNANSVWLNGHALDTDLEAALGRAIRLENDANCFALSEAADGAGAGAFTVFGVILGTGCGGGVVIGGRLLSGPNRIAGEWGHNPLPWARDDERPGPACFCGKHGCIETWLCGPGMIAEVARVDGRDVTPDAVAAAATAGEPWGQAALASYLDRLGRSLSSVVNVIDPDVIVLGGGLSNIRQLADAVMPYLAPHTFGDVRATRIVRNMHGDSSGVRGAAWLWTEAEAVTPP